MVFFNQQFFIMYLKAGDEYGRNDLAAIEILQGEMRSYL